MFILHTEASPGWGGQEFRILAEMAAMRERGHRLALAASPRGKILAAATAQGFTTIAVDFPGRFHLPSIERLRSFMVHEHVDVLNTHSAIDGWVGAFAAKLVPDVTVIRTRHLSIAVKKNWPTRWVYTSGAHGIITTGEALRQQLIRDNNFAAERIVSVPTGVDLSRFAPESLPPSTLRAELGIAADEPVVGVVAMLRRMKGHHVLLDALALLAHELPRLRAVFVGDVPSDSPVKLELLAQAERLGLKGRVTFAGYRDDIPNCLAAFDVAVLPSTRDEGVPQSLAQALAMGRPVVATSVGAVAELVVPEVTGLIAPPDNARALATAIARTLNDSAATAERIARGREHVRTHYTRAVMAEKVEAFYMRIRTAQAATINADSHQSSSAV